MPTSPLLKLLASFLFLEHGLLGSALLFPERERRGFASSRLESYRTPESRINVNHYLKKISIDCEAHGPTVIIAFRKWPSVGGKARKGVKLGCCYMGESGRSENARTSEGLK